jgi:glycyl-tRNA synthetase beta chain
MPAGLSDRVPTKPVSICAAIADKIDSLGQLFIAGERPTGSGDPYALRRAALGVIRILLENNLRLPLRKVLSASEFSFAARDGGVAGVPRIDDLLDFFADRLKVALREKGVRHDLIDAVFALGDEDDLVRLVRRVEALQSFLKSDDGANLLVGYRRAANILKIEEKKDKKEKGEYRSAPDTSALAQTEENALHGALLSAQESVAKLLEREDFAGAMGEMAKLREPVDRFFDKVTVNDSDPKRRENRLKLLAQIVATAHQVADFSKVEG